MYYYAGRYSDGADWIPIYMKRVLYEEKIVY